MSTKPRVSVTDPNATRGLRMIMGHQQPLFDAFYALYATMWSEGVLDQSLKEIVRIRNARTTDCGYCRQVRFDGAIGEGLDESILSQVDDDYLDSQLSARIKSVLQWTDVFLNDPAHCPPSLQSEVQSEIGQEGLVELAFALGLFRAFAKVLIVLGLEPEEGTMAVTVHATPGSSRRTG